MNKDRMKRLSDEYTEYSGSAKDVSSRIRNASAGAKDEKNPEGSKQADVETVRGPGDPGLPPGEADAVGEEEVIEPPEPTRLTDADLAKHPDEFLQTISEEGEESETKDGADAEDAGEGFQADGDSKPGTKEKADKEGESGASESKPLSPEEEAEVKKQMSAGAQKDDDDD
jgi:hypothetical protein